MRLRCGRTTDNTCFYICNRNVYLLQIFVSPHAPQKVVVCLFEVEKVGDEYMMLPVLDIGKFSVYLGPNQSFVLPSVDHLVGRLANTPSIQKLGAYLGVPR